MHGHLSNVPLVIVLAIILVMGPFLAPTDSFVWSFQVSKLETNRRQFDTIGMHESAPSSWRMDMERPDDVHCRHWRRSSSSYISSRRINIPMPISSPLKVRGTSNITTNSHGMPWKTSISPEYVEDRLFYMPFWEYQMKFMTEKLTNLLELPVRSKKGRDMSYVVDHNNHMRMHTCCYQSEEYRLIRMTTLDAGYRTQVFTSLWYPRDRNVPLLGIDFLQFNHGKKHLCIVDFQPMGAKEQDHDALYEHRIRPIRDQYPSLQGAMTDRFYNSNDPFFSNQMLLGRHNQKGENYTADEMVFRDLFPAFRGYLQAHLDMVTSCEGPKHDTRSKHREYDTYSAARDPAHALLARAFGQEWADDYVYDILFPSAERP